MKATPPEPMRIYPDARPDERLTDQIIMFYELIDGGVKKGAAAKKVGTSAPTASRWAKDAELRALFEEYRGNIEAIVVAEKERTALALLIEGHGYNQVAERLGVERRWVFNLARRKASREQVIEHIEVNREHVANQVTDAAGSAVKALQQLVESGEVDPRWRIEAAKVILDKAMPANAPGITVATQVNNNGAEGGASAPGAETVKIEHVIEASELDDEACHDIADVVYASRRRQRALPSPPESDVIDVEVQEASA